MHLQHRKTQHCETCCVTHCVTCSHRTVTCKRDDVWEAWYCPATVYGTRISPVFSEVISPNCAKKSRDVKPQKQLAWQIVANLVLSLSPKSRSCYSALRPKELPRNVDKILNNTVVFTTLKHITVTSIRRLQSMRPLGLLICFVFKSH